MISDSQGLWFCVKSGDRYGQGFVFFTFCQKRIWIFFFLLQLQLILEMEADYFYRESTFLLSFSQLKPTHNSQFMFP